MNEAARGIIIMLPAIYHPASAWIQYNTKYGISRSEKLLVKVDVGT